MSRNRFEFALRNVSTPHWERFESLSSAFLTDEYPSLRTVAGPRDRGRDAILWEPTDDPTVKLQYSITADWERKIKTSAEQIRRDFPHTRVLIFVSSQKIGTRVDAVRLHVRLQNDLYLDVRDSAWFLDRQNQSYATASAAEEFSAPIVDALLAENSLIENKIHALTENEARAAVVFLSMQWEDENREKGLTKLSFEALVKAALRDTDNDHRMSRTAICEWVRSILKHHNPEEVDKFTNAALARLEKRPVRHWHQRDEYCLSFEERQRRIEALIELELLDGKLNVEVLEMLASASGDLEQDVETSSLATLVPHVRCALESYLLVRGESFAQYLAGGEMMQFTIEELEQCCADEFTRLKAPTSDHQLAVTLGTSVLEEILVRPSQGAQRYLRALADGYTLFSFLRQVPDVQRAVQKIFSHGNVWLDTSAALPLLAELLLEPDERSYTRTIRTARQAGLELYVTDGVIDELFHHIRVARLCQQLGADWRSRMPFLFAAYLWSGRPPDDFKAWTVEFIGERQPLDDIAEFLSDVAGIRRRSLEQEVAKAEDSFRWAVEAYWQDVHRRRSQASDSSRDPETADQLAQHDVENFLGVIMARRNENAVTAFGYEHWWLTLDRRAYRAAREIAEKEGCEPFDSPVMSYDFLMNYIAVGPRRSDITKATESLLPLMLDMSLLDGIPEDILEIAQTTRDSMAGMSERVVRRTIRDALNAAKLRSGPIARAGLEAIETDIRSALEHQAK